MKEGRKAGSEGARQGSTEGGRENNVIHGSSKIRENGRIIGCRMIWMDGKSKCVYGLGKLTGRLVSKGMFVWVYGCVCVGNTNEEKVRRNVGLLLVLNIS